MKRTEIHTEVDIKCFEAKVTVVKDLTIKNSGKNYVYKIKHNDTHYILKGYKIQLEHLVPGNRGSMDVFLDGVKEIGEVFQEYYSAKTASTSSPHFTKPLLLDYSTHLASSQDKPSYIYMEIIFEYGGVALDDLEDITIKMCYNLMRQSANALSVLHDIGMVHFDIKPANMVYDKTTDMLKIIDMGSTYGVIAPKNITDSTANVVEKIRSTTLEYAPPEVLRTIKEQKNISRSKTSLDRFDVYCWGMSFYSLLLKKEINDLQFDNRKFKQTTEEDYNGYIVKVEKNLDSVTIDNLVEESMKEEIKKLISGALRYEPRERYTMKAIVSEMKKFERPKDIKTSCAEVEADNNRKLIEKPSSDETELHNIVAKEELKNTIFVEKANTMCDCKNCLNWINKKAKLSCGHAVCRDCLIQGVLKSFLKMNPYRYLHYCLFCSKFRKLTILVLDSGCLWTAFKNNLEQTVYYDKCSKINAIDTCLMNDYTSLKSVYLMIFGYMKEMKGRMTLYDEAIQNASMKSIEIMLRSNGIITHLCLHNKGIGDKGVTIIGKALKDSTSLKILNLELNNVEYQGARIISEILRANKTLTALHLNRNKLGREGAKCIAEALQINKTIAILDLGCNKMEYEGIKAVSEVLKLNKNLTELLLNNNDAGYEGGRAIGEALRANSTLLLLDLSFNKMRDEGAKVIGDALKHNVALIALYLNSNEIEVEGAKAIGKGLRTNKVLVILDLRGNTIGDEGTRAMGEALEENIALAMLSLGGNSIKDEGAKAIGKALTINKALTTLGLSNNNIGDEGAEAIGAALKANATLAIFHINENSNIKAKGAKAIAESLKTNSAFILFSIYPNRIGDEGEKAFEEAQRENKNIKILYKHTE